MNKIIKCLLVVSLGLLACSSSDTDPSGDVGETLSQGGSAGTGGSSGEAGTGGSDAAGSAGSGATGGSEPASCSLQEGVCVGSGPGIECCSAFGATYLYDESNDCFIPTNKKGDAYACAVMKGGCGANSAASCFVRETGEGKEYVVAGDLALQGETIALGYINCDNDDYWRLIKHPTTFVCP